MILCTPNLRSWGSQAEARQPRSVSAKAQLPIEHSRNIIYSADDSAELETHTFSYQWKSSGAGDGGARRTDADDASDGWSEEARQGAGDGVGGEAFCLKYISKERPEE